MKTSTTNPRVVNTDAQVKNDGKPRQPHERDTAPDGQLQGPGREMKQAYADIENGLVDTDLHGTPGVEATKNKTSLPHGSKGLKGSRDGR